MSIYFVDNFGVISFQRASIVDRYVAIQARIHTTIFSLEGEQAMNYPIVIKRILDQNWLQKTLVSFYTLIIITDDDE